MKPNHRVPLTVARGLAAPLPGVPVRALISTRAMMMSISAQNTGAELGMGMGRWVAEPMKRSMGMEKTTLVRDASPPRGPAGGGAGLAGLPVATFTAVRLTHLFWGQMTNHTRAHKRVPSRPRTRMTGVRG